MGLLRCVFVAVLVFLVLDPTLASVSEANIKGIQLSEKLQDTTLLELARPLEDKGLELELRQGSFVFRCSTFALFAALFFGSLLFNLYAYIKFRTAVKDSTTGNVDLSKLKAQDEIVIQIAMGPIYTLFFVSFFLAMLAYPTCHAPADY